MIISASRRTDIPAHYAQWMLNRLKTGEVLFPRGKNKLGHVVLSPLWVDCIVFWTKNPQPMKGMLKEITAMGYPYYFEFTLTPYPMSVEPLPPKERLVRTFMEFSDLLGPERVDWRYDPILLCGRYTVEYHLRAFAILCRRLSRYTTRCVVSFMDSYSHTGALSGGSPADMYALAKGFMDIAAQYGLPLVTCAEKIELGHFGIAHGACIDKAKLEQVVGAPLALQKDGTQRPECRCVDSVDIGDYNSCPTGCAYCYATHNPMVSRGRNRLHDPFSPLLIGHPNGTEELVECTRPSSRQTQMSFY